MSHIISKEDIEEFEEKVNDVQSKLQSLIHGKFDEINEIEDIVNENHLSNCNVINNENSSGLEKKKWWDLAKDYIKSTSSSNSIRKSPVSEHFENNASKVKSFEETSYESYTKWDKWAPNDPVSKEEERRVEEEKEKIFEKNNPEFCQQIRSDIETRKLKQKNINDLADALRKEGNDYYSKAAYDVAITKFMKALDYTPFDIRITTNIAQVKIKEAKYLEALEFLSRTLYIEPNNIKALLRKAYVHKELKQYKDATESLTLALTCCDGSNKIKKELENQLQDYKTLMKENELEQTLEHILNQESSLPSSVDLGSTIDVAKTKENIFYVERIVSELMSEAKFDSEFDFLVNDMIFKLEENSFTRVYLRTSKLLVEKVLSGITQEYQYIKSNIVADDTVRNRLKKLSYFLRILVQSLSDQRTSQVISLEVFSIETISDMLTIILQKIIPNIRNLCEVVDIVSSISEMIGIYLHSNIFYKSIDLVMENTTFVMKLSDIISDLIDLTPSENTIRILLSKLAFISSDYLIYYAEQGQQNHVMNMDVISKSCQVLTQVTYYLLSNQMPDGNSSTNVIEMYMKSALLISQEEGLRHLFHLEFGCKYGHESNTLISSISVLLEISRKSTEHEINCISILMNCCYGTSPVSLQNKLLIAKTGLTADIIKDLEQTMNNTEYQESRNIDVMCRKIGLLAKLVTIQNTVTELSKSNVYRLLCQKLQRNILITSSSLNNDIKWIKEEIGYLVLILAAIKNPSAELLSIGAKLNIPNLVMTLLPEPRKELNEVTWSSVSLAPDSTVNTLLVGNTACLLLPYADVSDIAKSVFSLNRDTLHIEKLVCAMANCYDSRVRKNLSILIAKGCRNQQVRDRVTELRGMEIIRELNK